MTTPARDTRSERVLASRCGIVSVGRFGVQPVTGVAAELVRGAAKPLTGFLFGFPQRGVKTGFLCGFADGDRRCYL
jgi:hypothetical protein